MNQALEAFERQPDICGLKREGASQLSLRTK